jgi:dTDP-4-amino-4,6-dideoxygalactose transaminase
MVQNKIRLAKPFISEEAIQQVNEVLRSGNLVQGVYVSTLETKLAEYLECNHVIVVSSGTAALHLAIIAAGIGPGDEVIIPAFTFPATANVIELVGATPILVDIGLDDYCIDVHQIEKAITPGTKAIMPVHEFGQATNMEILMQVAESNKLIVIEDAACGLGTEFNGKKAGTFGTMGCFSFHPRKAITTGEGGAIATNNPDYANLLRSLRNHGLINHQGHNDIAHPGFNYRLTDFQAVIALHQLINFEETIRIRKNQALEYNYKFEALPLVKAPEIFNNRKHTFQTYHLLLDTSLNRNNIVQELMKKGIETNFGAYAIQSLHYYQKKYGLTPEMFPNALNSFQQGLALPLGQHLTDHDLDYIYKTFYSLSK